MNIEAITELKPATLNGTTPDPASYDAVSDSWKETEYRADFNNPQVEGGYWTGSAGSVSFDSWPYTELCVILHGEVAIEDILGNTREFHAGDAFVIPQGFRGTWHTRKDTQKIFMGIHAAN